MKSILMLILAIAALYSPETMAYRACTPEDYGMMQSEVYSCLISINGRTTKIEVYSNSLGMRIDTHGRIGDFRKGPQTITYSKLQCPESRNFNIWNGPTTQDGLSVSITQSQLPQVVVQSQTCVVSRQNYNNEMEPDYEFEVINEQETVQCEYIGLYPVATKTPGLNICGFPDNDY